MGEDLQSKASDFVRKILTVGVGTIFLTEESLRNLVSEFKLPKEFLGSILESAGKTKREFMQSLSQEILARVSEGLDPKAFLDEFLRDNEVELHVKLKFNPRKISKT